MRAGDHFRAQLTAIDRLYRATIYSYARTIEAAAHQDESAASSSDLDPLFAGVPLSLHLARRRFEGRYPEHLREALLVRAVSIFETFIVDTIREAFTTRRDLFYSNDKVEFASGFVLRQNSLAGIFTQIINRDIRELTSGGLRKMIKYLKTRLNIDIATGPHGPSSLYEIVDRRHLLVHRLGETDDKYRHDYLIEARRITVGRTYFKNSLSILRDTASFIDEQADRLVQRPLLGSGNTPSTALVEIDVILPSRRGRAALMPEFMFEHEDEILRLGDLLIQSFGDRSSRTLRLEGEPSHIRSYVSVLRWLEFQGELEVLRNQIYRHKRTGTGGYPVGLVEKVQKALPEGTIPDGFKRNLAERLGISVAKLRRIIEYLQHSFADDELLQIEQWLSNNETSDHPLVDIASHFNMSKLRARRAWDLITILRRERDSTGAE
ncbi:hypothetical protein [Sorangium sp. So ce542]|uniref:hypothetical protein n=1 Tax=Sorangium sp. So ce542 TaxID=3133316 RepID=UPI003F5F99C0